MKRGLMNLSLLMIAMLIASPVFAQVTDTTKIRHGIHFVDRNGDGYNDNAPDADGDGIPNGLDPDYTGAMRFGATRGWVDLDGDGINDNARDDDGDGIPNGLDPDYVGKFNQKGPRGFVDLDGDGINDNRGGRRGNGAAAVGPRMGANSAGAALRAGDCDGTGPKGAVGMNRGRGSKGRN